MVSIGMEPSFPAFLTPTLDFSIVLLYLHIAAYLNMYINKVFISMVIIQESNVIYRIGWNHSIEDLEKN